jgi:hypothetical protein
MIPSERDPGEPEPEPGAAPDEAAEHAHGDQAEDVTTAEEAAENAEGHS